MPPETAITAPTLVLDKVKWLTNIRRMSDKAQQA
jgi:hypothetical protein